MLLIKRSGAQAAVSGNLALTGTALENLVWRRNDRPVTTGLLDAKGDSEGTGRSIAGIVANLAGGGSFTVHDGEIRSINPAAFASVIRAADAGFNLKPEEVSKGVREPSRYRLAALQAYRRDAGGGERYSAGAQRDRRQSERNGFQVGAGGSRTLGVGK
ncbi:AsmA-like C-terminal region-containing protein [Breoghania sp.]|uniref:AsmA-like C-terminal region-containing protein n=1 Tax=Breoghania sp. TaxID=2065378 RepID=UPI002623CE5F|nr:AsmA-like C-terminal region-containing protein [Breoghania sp.]MDJ0931180.1 hypothetical protein [Breoghania sp.]